MAAQLAFALSHIRTCPLPLVALVPTAPFPYCPPFSTLGCFGVMTLQCTLPFTPHLVCPKVQELTLKQMLGWNLSSMLCIIHHHGATYDQSQWPEYNLLSNLTKIEVGTARSQGLF